MNSTAKNTIIYAYRLTSDSGSAPCIYDLDGKPTGILTLVCCKGGQIRNESTKNEVEIKTGLRHTVGKRHMNQIADGSATVYILGIYKDKLLYFAKITKIITMAEYFLPNSSYKNRHDYIYETLPKGFKRNDNNLALHPIGETARHRRDWLGEYALISDCFAYFGKESIYISQELLNILPKAQENKHYDGTSPAGVQIMNEVKAHWDFKNVIQKESHDYYRKCKNRRGRKDEDNLIPKRVRHC